MPPGDLASQPAESPQQKAIIDPTHPHAGKGGVVPPESGRIQPGEVRNPGGRPKGASIRAALLRRFARDPDADGIGRECGEVADELASAARSGDEARTKTLTTLVHEIEGKPQEHVHHSGQTTRTITVRPGIENTPQMP